MKAVLQDYLDSIKEKVKSGKKLSDAEIKKFNKVKTFVKRENFYNFCKEMTGFDIAWFQKLIIDEANALFKDKKGRLMVQMAQQHGKTAYLGTLFPAFIMGHYPDWKILYLTYSDARAKEVSANVLEHMTNEKYQKLFPEFKLKDELDEEVRAAKKRRNKLGISNFTNANSSRGEWKAVGIEGSYNGYDANLIILDDYFAGQHEAMSDTVNETRWLCWTRNVLTRQQKDNIIVVIGTQWRLDDIIGRMTDYTKNIPDGAMKWKHLIFNAIKDERNYEYDKRKIGEYLWPEKKMNFYLEYKTIDPIGFAITAMNKPEIFDLKIFSPESFRYYDEKPDTKGMTIIISCDPNYSKLAKKGDDSAIVVLGIKDSKVYVLDFWGQPRVSHRDTMAQINVYKERYPNYLSLLIEDKAGGEALCQLFEENGERKIERFIPPCDNTGMQGKKLRAQYMLPQCNAGAFYVPSSKLNPLTTSFVNQFLLFTGAEGGKDDFVDATSQVFVHYNYLLNPPIVKKATYSIKNRYFLESRNPFLKNRVYAV